MTLNLIRRPQKPITADLDSIFTAGSSPVIYRLERQDFQVSFVGPSITDPGFYLVHIAGDHTEEIFLGTLIHISAFDTLTGNRIFIPTTSVIAIAFNGGSNETEISVSESFFGVLGDAGLCNNLSRTNYFVEVQIVVTQTGRELFTTRLKYFPTIVGTVIVDLSPLVNSFLDPETPFESQFYVKPNSIQPFGTFGFYITYQERFDGSLTGVIDDSGNPQIVTNSVRQILQAASPNMAPFVPFPNSLREVFINPDFFPDFDPWANAGTGWGAWSHSVSAAVISAVGQAEGARSQTLTQPLFEDVGAIAWHETVNQIIITVKIESPGMLAFLELVDINDEEDQDNFKPGILRNPDGTIKENKIQITETVGSQTFTLDYQPSQNATRIGVRIISGGPGSMIVSVFSFFFFLPERRYLTREGSLKMWRGFPFTISWIYSDLILGADLQSIEVWNDVNGNPVNIIIRDIDPAGALQINTQSFSQDEFITSKLPDNVHSIDASIGGITTDTAYGPDYIANGWQNVPLLGPVWTVNNNDITITLTEPGVGDICAREDPLIVGRTYIHILEISLDREPVADQNQVTVNVEVEGGSFSVVGQLRFDQMERIGPLTWRGIVSFNWFRTDQDPSNRVGVQAISFEVTPLTYTIEAYSVISYSEKVIETKRIQVLEPCDNPVYLQWVNQLGGLDYWLFDHNQELANQIIDGRKFNQVLSQAENITNIEYEALDYLNHPGQITDIRRVDPDFTVQDKTVRRQGTQAYILDNDQSGDKKGIIIQPFISPRSSLNTTHKIQIRFLMPEQFVTQ